jgi:hypothetical protein
VILPPQLSYRQKHAWYMPTDGRTLYIVTAQWPNDFRTPTGQVLAVQVTVPSAGAATEG